MKKEFDLNFVASTSAASNDLIVITRFTRKSIMSLYSSFICWYANVNLAVVLYILVGEIVDRVFAIDLVVCNVQQPPQRN
jgi:hypothetical protein